MGIQMKRKDWRGRGKQTPGGHRRALQVKMETGKPKEKRKRQAHRWPWWFTSVISVLGRLRREDHGSGPAWPRSEVPKRKRQRQIGACIISHSAQCSILPLLYKVLRLLCPPSPQKYLSLSAVTSPMSPLRRALTAKFCGKLPAI